MNKIILSILFFLFVPMSAYALPAISFTEMSYDFGAIIGGDKVEHVFEFVNAGDQELVIEKVTSS